MHFTKSDLQVLGGIALVGGVAVYAMEPGAVVVALVAALLGVVMLGASFVRD